MRVVVQRVKSASVVSNDLLTGEINFGLLVLVGFTHTDGRKEIDWMIGKLINLRIFSDDEGKMNRSVQDINGDILLVSQFTLYGDARKGNRPSFMDAAKPDFAETLYNDFKSGLSIASGKKIPSGIFAADMQVSLVNDGPVTLIIDSPSS